MLELSSPPTKEAAAIIAALLPRHAWSERAVSGFVRRLRRNRCPLLSLESDGRKPPVALSIRRLARRAQGRPPLT